MSQFKADLDAGKFKAQVAADQKLAANLKARGTPHFFVNGRRLRGAQPFPRFKALIDEMLKK
jgi:protein-disulfide isomerase